MKSSQRAETHEEDKQPVQHVAGESNEPRCSLHQPGSVSRRVLSRAHDIVNRSIALERGQQTRGSFGIAEERRHHDAVAKHSRRSLHGSRSKS